jgi:hypothetical protein
MYLKFNQIQLVYSVTINQQITNKKPSQIQIQTLAYLPIITQKTINSKHHCLIIKLLHKSQTLSMHKKNLQISYSLLSQQLTIFLVNQHKTNKLSHKNKISLKKISHKIHNLTLQIIRSPKYSPPYNLNLVTSLKIPLTQDKFHLEILEVACLAIIPVKICLPRQNPQSISTKMRKMKMINKAMSKFKTVSLKL